MTSLQPPDYEGKPPGSTWCLRLVDGSMAWSTWPISETGLVVGRGLGCHLRLDDMRVSRIQCEVLLRDKTPFLRNRSGRNPTFVNGALHEETALQLGDLIEFCGYRIIVDVVSHDALPPLVKGGAPPTTQPFERSPYLRRRLEASESEPLPGYASDLLALFSVARTLGRCSSLDSLIEELCNHLMEKMSPHRCWIALRVRAGGEVMFYPPLDVRETLDAPLEALRDTCRTRCGVLVPPAGVEDGALLVAPLVHGGAAYGAIAVRRDASRGYYDDRDLHYLLAVAECAAPLIQGVERLEQLQRDERRLAATQAPGNRLVGRSEIMRDVRARIAQAAEWRSNVLILGETGVGKELAARMIHEASPRAQGPYVVVSCAAIPEDLFESEMFGHERGAFTGAVLARKGVFETAHGGTLFLDEVGELTPANQARLLRVVETHEFRRVGGEKDIHVDVRILSATNRALPESEHSTFRPDLYHRLASLVLWMPPLRERTEDIPDLSRHFLDDFARQVPGCPRDITEDALNSLKAYAWPGNIRELRNVLERCCYRNAGPLLDQVDLPAKPASTSAAKAPKTLDELEREHLLEVLRTHEGNVANAARAIGIPASTLYYKLRRHKISLRNPS